MPTLSLSFLNRRTINKQVCRVCHELAELKAERLCGDCARIKAQIQVRISQLPDGDANKQPSQCKRAYCLCTACGGRILDPHPFCQSDPKQAHGREVHFHPRCHALWLEIGLGVAPATTSTLIIE